MLISLDNGSAHIVTVSSDGKVFSHSKFGWVASWGYIANFQDIVSLLAPAKIHSSAQAVAQLVQKIKPLGAAKRIAGTASWLYWDRAETCLWIMADRMGLTPVYYTQTNIGWLFSSSIPTILEATRQSEPNETALIAATLGRHPPLGQTYYRNIHQIQPGRLVNVQSGCWREQIYWQAELPATLHLGSSEQYDQAYRELLFKIVDQYAPDMHTAVTLSSGLDSSSLAVALRAVKPERLLTGLSFISPELPMADETIYIKEICQILNIEPIFIRADHLWTFKTPEAYAPLRDGPFFGFYSEIWEAIFNEAHQHNVKILLGGSGGDLLFGGSTPAYADLFLRFRWRELVHQLHQHIPRSAFSSPWKTIPGRFILRPILSAYRPIWLQNRPRIPPFITSANRLTAMSLMDQPRPRRSEKHLALPGAQFRLKCLTFPPEARFLPFQISVASNFGIEMRYPLWDHRFVEFALSLPSDQIYHAGYTKWIVRRSLRGRLPESVLDMFNKIVPAAIAARGLRERSVGTIKKFLSHMRLEELGVVNANLVKQAYQDYLDGKTDSIDFFLPVFVEAWLRRWH